jgi:hypothetical protein
MPLPTPQERDAEIIRELEHFNATGDVSSLPLIGFDQNGKWIGMKQFSTQENFPEKLTKKIRKLKVPKDVLVAMYEGGKRLQTSFVIETDEPVTIDYQMIDGNLIVKSTVNPQFHAPNLTDVEGKIEIMAAHVDMPNLLCVGDFTVLLKTETLNIPRLAHALRCVICPLVKEFNAPELLIVKGDCFIPSATAVDLPKLTGTERHFLAGNATTFIAPDLKFVGERLDTSSARNFYIKSLEVGEWLRHPDAERLFVRKALRQPTIEL